MNTKTNTETTRKAIAWVRCSTDKQHTTGEQLKEITALAARDGYSPEDLIVIGREGASAIKVDAAYKADLDLMYSYMNRGAVAAVYAWAVDRIGRDQKENTFFKYKLLDCGVEFKTVEGVNLTAADDGITAVILDLKQRIAEDEMKKKAERFRIGKNRNRQLGRHNGGRILFGYTTVEGYYKIDEEKAAIVRRVFDTFNNTPISARQIAKQLTAEGVIKHNNPKSAETWCIKILRNEKYTGLHPYSRIITDEQYNAAQVKLDNSKCECIRHNVGCLSYAHGLLFVDSEISKTKRYQMQIHRYDGQFFEPNTGYTLDADSIDSLLVYATNNHIAAFTHGDMSNAIADGMAKMEQLRRVADTALDAVEAKNKALERVADAWVNGMYDDAKKTLKTRQLTAERAQQAQIADDALARIEELTDRLAALQDGVISDLYSLTDEDVKEQLNKYIDNVVAERVCNGTYNVKIQYKMGTASEVYKIRSKAHKYYRIDGENETLIDMPLLKRYNKVRRANR